MCNQKYPSDAIGWIQILLAPGPVFTKGLSQGLGLKLRLLSQVCAQNLLRLSS